MQEKYPVVVDSPAGGPPPLADGQRATGYPNDYSMSVEAGGGAHALVESITPIALETEDGGHEPLDLSLHEINGWYQPATGLAQVRIGKNASEGAVLVDRGVSLTPVAEEGAPLSASGSVDHSGVFYGDTENAQVGARDLSMLTKPTTDGFEMFSTLFSARSPEHLFFKVGMPEGATLEQSGSREVRVMREGQAIAIVSAFMAQDAEGTPVPVSVGVPSTGVVELTVARKPGQFRYPLVVDPAISDPIFLPYLSPAWVSCASSATKCPLGPEDKFAIRELGEGYAALVENGSAFKAGEWGDYQYETQGNSKIYKLETETLERDYFTETETLLEAYSPGGTQENWGLLANNADTSRFGATICAVKTTECLPAQGANKNLVEFVKRILAEGAGGFEDRLYLARVWIYQEESPTVTFNTTSPTIEVKEPNGTVVNRNNVLYPGNKEWIGPFTDTAFEMTAKDPGIGVSLAQVDGGTWSRVTSLTSEGDCRGVQCPEEFKGKYTYFTTTPGHTSPIPSGEYSIEGRAEDSVTLKGVTHATVRVDALGPQGIKITNLPAGGQIGEGAYKIKAEATDGKTGEPSSGVASLKLGIDGAEAAEPLGSCPAGPCTATAEWTINGGQLTAGPHTLTVLATDNAGNVEHEDFVIYVHHATPMSVGPGSLDPQSGNYSLGSTDVSMGPGLTVSRAYSSRDLTAGIEGALGPQWALSVGGNSESVEELPDGSMMLIAANGGETVFSRDSKGELESPMGDANLKLSVEENEQKLPIAYTLKDIAAGTTTKFTRSENYLQSTPIYYGQLDWQGPSSSQFVDPTGVAADPKGDVWVTDTRSDRVEKFNPQGEFVSQFGYEGTGAGAFKEPRAIAIDAKGNLWVADTGNNRIEEFTESGTYIRTFGTEGAGTLKKPYGIATEATGRVWVADTVDNRLVEFNEVGEYLREASKIGSTTLSEPLGVATDTTGHVWASDQKNHRFVEYRASNGEGMFAFGSAGTGNGQFETPSGIATDSAGDVWVADYAENRVQEFNSKGEYLTKVGSTGSNGGQLKKPYSIAVDGRGDLVVADSENARVGRWTHATWTPATSEGPVATSAVTYTYKTVLVKGGTVTHPTEVVAPHPAELSCAPTVNKGCRVLRLRYAEKTTAEGENESEWKDYEGRLKEVLLVAYNPATAKVEEKAVAQYAYDTQGRLRAEWDPRIEASSDCSKTCPSLKTVYGYDSEGRVTAVLPPGQEPWLLHYGTIPTDASAGRLLSVTRPAATTEPGSRLAPKNTTLPTLSTSTPTVGSKISVSTNGAWSNTPLTYSYQWEDCNSSGGECVAIAGAVNNGYYPALSDEKRKLVALVTAVNAGGSTTVATTATGLVGPGTPSNPAPEPPNPGTAQLTTIEYAVPLSGTGLQNLTAAEVKKWGQEDVPVEGTVVFPPDTPMGWPAKEYVKSTISYFDAEGHAVNNVNSSGGVSTAEYDLTNNLVRTLSPDNRALALAAGEKSVEVAAKLDTRKVYNEEGDELLETLGPEHKVKLSTGSEVQARHRVRYSYDQNAPSEKTYRLVTETVSSALVGGKELDQKVTQTHYFGQNELGWTLRKPTSVTVDPYGLKLTTTTLYNKETGAVIETGATKGVHENEINERPTYASSFGSYGTGNGQLREPEGGLATDASGNVWVSDTENSRLEEFNSKGEFVRTTGSSGEGAGQFDTTYGVTVDSSGNVWATDEGNDRVEEFTSGGVFVKMFGWGVSNGEAKFQTCTVSCRAGLQGSGNGEFYVPEGIAVDSKGNIFVADRGNHRVQEFNSSLAWVRNISQSEEKEGPFYLNIDPKTGNLWVAYSWDNKIGEFTNEGVLIKTWGTAGSEPGQLSDPYGVAIGPEGNVWVSEYGNNRVQVFSQNGVMLYGVGAKGSGPGQFNQAPHGLAFTGNTVYVLDSGIWSENTGNSRVEKWTVTPEFANTDNAHDSQTIYYSAAANSTYPTCGGHVEWEGMPCKTLPSAQPEGSSASPLPVTTTALYNMWGEPETSEETFGSTTRTKKIKYDEAGRPAESEVTSTADTSVPKVTNGYSETTGQLTTQSTTAGEETQTITSAFDRLGRLTSYTDADKKTTNYEYESSGDGRLLTVTDEKGSQSYAYDPTTGLLIKLLDSTAKAFTASYDLENHLTTETFPNGMTATYTRDPTDETVGVQYVKTTNCTEKCVLFSESVVSAIDGETLSRSNTLTSDAYTYDVAGRLTQTTEEPVGKGCVTRIYAYDEESNRTRLATREPGPEGKCATEGGTTEAHSYDAGNRLVDTGVSYDAFGDTTKLPASDAGGHELTSEYYVDGQVRKQIQNGQTNTYSIDPAGRVRKTVGEGTTNLTAIDHYDGGGEALTWRDEGEGKYTRLIPGIDGSPCATQTNGGTPVLQLHDLQGDVVGTAALSETETKLLSTYNSTEFGVQVNGPPPTKYSWFGAEGMSSELSSGSMIMGTVSYVPQLGRLLETQAVIPPGVAINGAQGVPFTAQASAWSIQANETQARTDQENYDAELQRAAEKEAEEKACAIASMCQTPGENYSPGEGEDEEIEEIDITVDERKDGGGAHIASGAPAIECNLQADHPHASTHVPGTVNFEIYIQCTDTVYDLRMRAVLYFNGLYASESGYALKGDTASAKENTAVTCRSGTYQGWGYADWKLPEYEGPMKGSGWSIRIKVKC